MNKTKLYILIFLILAIICYFIFRSFLGDRAEASSENSLFGEQKTTGFLSARESSDNKALRDAHQRARSDDRWFDLAPGVDTSMRSTRLLELFLEYAHGDEEKFHRTLLKWFEENPSAALYALQEFDKADFTPKFSINLDLIAQALQNIMGNEQGLLFVGEHPQRFNIVKKLLGAVAVNWETNNPEGFRSWFGENKTFVEPEAISSLAEFYARNNPKDAVGYYLNNLNDSEERKKHLIDETLEIWINSDPNAVADFINAMDPTPFFDEAVSTYAMGISADFPESALEWANNIVGKAEKGVAIGSIEIQLYNSNPQKFKQYFANKIFETEEKRQEYLQIIKNFSDTVGDDFETLENIKK